MLVFSPTFNYREEGMGFKKIKKEFSFADVVLESSFTFDRINIIRW